MSTKQYNVDNVKIVLTAAGIPYAITCRHEDGFEDDPNTESSSSTMERLHKLWKGNKGLFPMFMVITDTNTNETYIYNGVSFKKKAALKYANESGTEARAWEFEAESRELVI